MGWSRMGAYEGSGVHIGGIGERCSCRNRNLKRHLSINFHHLLLLYCGASAGKEMDMLSQLKGEGGGLTIYLPTL
jgi:hypothetical protein